MKKIKLLFAALILTSSFIYSQGFDVVPGVPAMNVTRLGHASVSLPDGKVLVIGGHTQGFEITATAEIYDPQAASWMLYNIDNPHDGCSYVKRGDGKYMFFGGFGGGYGIGQSTVTTIFDPTTTQFTAGPQMNVARAYSTAVTLTDNRVMIVGNWYNTGDAEIFDPSTNSFTSIGIPIAQRTYPLVFPTNDGGAVILAGNGNYGTPAFTDIVHYDPISMQFTTLASELIAGETGWTTSWTGSSALISDMKLSNGNYIFMMMRDLGSSQYEYAFAEFNPATKEVTKINSTPELPMYNGTSPNEWSYGLNIMKHPTTDLVYFVGTGSSSTPARTRLYSFSPSTGTLEIPQGDVPLGMYLSSSSKSWVDDDILCTGGSIDGSNFEVTNMAMLLRPQNSLGIEEIPSNSTGIQVFPNPVSSGSFQVNSFNHGIRVIDIIDLRGVVVKSIQVNANEQTHLIDRGAISNGLYFLRMTGSNAVYTKKIIFK